MENISKWRLKRSLLATILILAATIAFCWLVIWAALKIPHYERCETKECFMSYANACYNARWSSESSIGTVEYKASKCYFLKTMEKMNSSEASEIKEFLEGKSLMCQYNQGQFNEAWIDSLSDGIENCQGELKEAIGDLMIYSQTSYSK